MPRMQCFRPANHLNEEVLALHRFWVPDISQVRILPFRLWACGVNGTRLFCTQELSVRIRACPRQLRLRRSPGPDRLLVKTLGFQPGKQSSILCRDARIASVIADFRKPAVLAALETLKQEVTEPAFRGSSTGRALDC